MSEKELCRLPVQSMQDIVAAGHLVAQSGMLGVTNPAEGFIVVATCIQEGMSLLKFSERYNVICGRCSMKAEAMLANLLDLGGSYKVISRTAESAAIEVKYRDASYTARLDWTDAQKETYTRQKDGRTLKDNWSTPRRRMQMLWARVVSDGVRVVCPLATRGTYTPEEVMDFEPREPRIINDDGVIEPKALPDMSAPTSDDMAPPTALAAPAVPDTPPAAPPSGPTPAPAPNSVPTFVCYSDRRDPQSHLSQPAPAAPAAPAPAPAQSAAPAAPAVQLPSMPSSLAGTPFAEPPVAAGAKIDYSVCRAEGPFKGKAWADIDTDNLKLALHYASPNILDGDRAVITEILNKKGIKS